MLPLHGTDQMAGKKANHHLNFLLFLSIFEYFLVFLSIVLQFNTKNDLHPIGFLLDFCEEVSMDSDSIS